MKAKELRIGNLVMYSSVIEANEHKIRECVEYPDRFVPLSLSPEWLVKLGFEHILNNLEDFYAIGYDEGDWYFGVSEYMGNYHICGYNAVYRPIKYVHQLQNLYFTLTGEELCLKNNL